MDNPLKVASPSRRELCHHLRVTSDLLLAAGSDLGICGSVRLRLLESACSLASVLDRIDALAEGCGGRPVTRANLIKALKKGLVIMVEIAGRGDTRGALKFRLVTASDGVKRALDAVAGSPAMRRRRT
jgi:hypothetical protein